MYRPVQESLVLVSYASRGVSGETAHLRSIVRAFEIALKRRDVDKSSIKIIKKIKII